MLSNQISKERASRGDFSSYFSCLVPLTFIYKYLTKNIPVLEELKAVFFSSYNFPHCLNVVGTEGCGTSFVKAVDCFHGTVCAATAFKYFFLEMGSTKLHDALNMLPFVVHGTERKKEIPTVCLLHVHNLWLVGLFYNA